MSHPRGKKGPSKKRGAKGASTSSAFPIRLNRYIAQAGICSRRQADDLIAQGKIRVNDQVVSEMGFQVKAGDKVSYGGKVISPERPVYVLLNKPKDFITTTKDPQGRRTVMDLVRKASDSRLYPVGRLDRNTLGLLLLTNDGDLAKKLTHPSHQIAKVYHVLLDAPLTEKAEEELVSGLPLEDGKANVDVLEVLDRDRKELGLEIHSGKNRIVRRMFEHLGLQVVKLDRVVFGGLTKKDLPRGKWRYLTPREIKRLKKL